MSKLPAALALDQETAQLLLAAQCHIGTKNCETGMSGYVYARRADGTVGVCKLLLSSHESHHCIVAHALARLVYTLRYAVLHYARSASYTHAQAST